MKLLLAIGLATLAYAYAGHSYPLKWHNNGPMDGTVWEVRIKSDSWFSFSHKDTLIFDSGRMAAVNYMATGFPSGTYAAAGDKDQYSWQASFEGTNNDVIEWTGHIKDSRIEGDIIQREPAGRMRQMHFKGSRKLS